jgi:O-antigen/teichoic acid export membrane protein
MQAESTPRQSRSHAVLRTATATGIILACGVITGLISARSLGPTGRGQLAAITVWASTFLYAGTLGLAEAVVYFAAAEPALRARIWMTAQVGAVILGILITAAGWVLIPLIFSGGGDPAVVGWIQWFLLLFAVPCLSSLCACSWLQGAGRLGAFNVSRTLVHVVNAIAFLILLLARDSSVWHFASALLIGNAATWLVAGALGPWRSVGTEGPSLQLARRMLHYGLRVQIGNWSNAMNVRLDQLLLSLFAPAASLGVYVVAVTYANVIMTLPGSAALVMLPEIVSEHREGRSSACLTQWYRRLLWTTVTGCAVVAASGAYLLPLLFGQAYDEAVPLLVILGPAAVLLGMNQIVSTAFDGIDRPQIGSAAELVGLVVTAVSLVALLPRFGMYGAAIASLVAYGAGHVYLLRQAVTVFGGDFRSLCIPTSGDVQAMWRAGAAARGMVRRAPSTPAGTSALP